MTWNFPASKAGQITFTVRIEGSGLGIALLDHWMNPCDPTVREYASFYFELTGSDIPNGKWRSLRLEWNVSDAKAHLYDETDGEKEKTPHKSMFTVNMKNIDIPHGISYIHFQTLAQEEDFKGAYVGGMGMKFLL